ncbi:hypothetical protein DASB73_032570 [Starmerella bacillaris]|uniref:Thioesterase domain-containing protein n=1 Tax=Starmerella bacillaris TaxID=1247836 RepID=A0AAV5RP49_STABA|nr:hypothetical protein DASB73_032570 [Starmerella bacillaris]
MSINRVEFVKSVWEECRLTSGFDQTLFKELYVVSASDSHVVLRLPIQFIHSNRLQSVHGGLLSSLVDIGGSLSISTKGLFKTGVSVEIQTSFMNPGGVVGETLEIRGTLNKLGGTLAFTSVEIWNVENGVLAARGSHTKHVKAARDSSMNVPADQLV